VGLAILLLDPLRIGGVLGFGIPRAEPITEDGVTLTAPLCLRLDHSVALAYLRRD